MEVNGSSSEAHHFIKVLADSSAFKKDIKKGVI